MNPNYTSRVSDRDPKTGEKRSYTRFWTPEEIAERQAEEAAWAERRTKEAEVEQQRKALRIDELKRQRTRAQELRLGKLVDELDGMISVLEVRDVV